MMSHEYVAEIMWTGNRGQGTKTYKGYDRTWTVATPGKPLIACSNDPLLGGDPALHNPEDLLLASLAACHMLWYLHLAGAAGVQVTAYSDRPVGFGQSAPDGSGEFVRAVLHPSIRIAGGASIETADAIHGKIHQVCFIARSVRFPVVVEATYETT